MTEVQKYPKRLIEVDLPIRKISEHARHEKAIRHGHLSTLHIWWARRPLAACRSVTLAALLPDPVDPTCPVAFREEAASVLSELRGVVGGPAFDWGTPEGLREALLRFVGEIAAPEHASSKPVIAAARQLVAAAHSALHGSRSDRPLVFDPFAGGGAIPVEALRLGADVFASDLNPIAVLLNCFWLPPDHPQSGMKLRTTRSVLGAGGEMDGNGKSSFVYAG